MERLKTESVTRFWRRLQEPPEPAELEILTNRFRKSVDMFKATPSAAEELVHVGEAPVDKTIDLTELAAMTTVTGLILNLDEVLTSHEPHTQQHDHEYSPRLSQSRIAISRDCCPGDVTVWNR